MERHTIVVGASNEMDTLTTVLTVEFTQVQVAFVRVSFYIVHPSLSHSITFALQTFNMVDVNVVFVLRIFYMLQMIAVRGG